MLNTLRHLLPDSTAWRLVVERTLKKYLRGVATVGSDTVGFVDDVYDDLWPDLTRELQEWLNQFGIDYWPWSNDDDMRAYLDFRWGEDRSTSPQALQDKLRAAGFQVSVYDSFEHNSLALSTDTGDLYAPAEDTALRGFCFGHGGWKLYVAGDTNDAVFQYSLSEPYKVSTATYDSVSKGVTTEDDTPRDVRLSSDGMKLFVLGAENNAVYEYDNAAAWDIDGATYVDSMSVSAKEIDVWSFSWSPDGTEVYVVGHDSDDVHQYTLGAAWDVSTGGFTRTYDPSYTNPTGIAFADDGMSFCLADLTVNLDQYNLSTAWDISTASAGDSLSMIDVDTAPLALYIAGNLLFMLGSTGDAIYRLRYGAWRDPLDYAVQPLAGTVQCGDDGSGANPVAECGEEPPDQVSLDSAVCNNFLANEVWYLVNDTLTDDAPPPIPTDSAQWGPFWYVGSGIVDSVIQNIAIDEYDRQRFEKLLLKHGPAEAWIVTPLTVLQTTLISTWDYELAAGSLDSGEWQFTTGTTTPLKIHDEDNNGTDQSTPLSSILLGNILRFVRGDDGTWVEYLTGTASDQTTYWSIPITVSPVGQSSDWAGFPGAGVEMQIYHRESV